MGALLRRLWSDPAYFVGAVRGLLMLLAELFRQDVIPTGVPGGGAKIAGMLMIAAVAIPAGETNARNGTGYPRPEPTERRTVTPSGGGTGV